jgi:LacI family transcriptional regulator
VLVPATNVEITAMKVRYLEKQMTNYGLDMFIAYTHGRLENAINIATKLQARGIDGMFVFSQFVDEKCVPVNPATSWKSRTPTVFLDALVPIDKAHVYLDRGAGMQQAVEHLFELGHREIFLFTPEVMLNEPRSIKFIECMNNAGLSGREHCYLIDESARCAENHACFSAEAILASATEFFKQHPECTAIMCTSDMLAITVQTALHSLGIRVPQDVSLVGFDNIPAGLSCFPQLTTISQPVGKLAVEAMKMMLVMMEDETVKPHAVALPTELIVRKSTDVPRNTSNNLMLQLSKIQTI